MKKTHHIMVTIECLDSQTPKDARARLKRWIEHYGHTDNSFGFRFIDVGHVTMKVVQDGDDI